MKSNHLINFFYDKRNNFKVPILGSWIFWCILGVKIIASEEIIEFSARALVSEVKSIEQFIKLLK